MALWCSLFIILISLRGVRVLFLPKEEDVFNYYFVALFCAFFFSELPHCRKLPLSLSHIACLSAEGNRSVPQQLCCYLWAQIAPVVEAQHKRLQQSQLSGEWE